MRKKLFAMVVACAVLLGVSACGSESIDTPEDGTPAESTPADYSVPPETPEETAGEDEEHEESLEDLIERNNIAAAIARLQMTFLLADLAQVDRGQSDDTAEIIIITKTDSGFNVETNISTIEDYKEKPHWWNDNIPAFVSGDINQTMAQWFNIAMFTIYDDSPEGVFAFVAKGNECVFAVYSEDLSAEEIRTHIIETEPYGVNIQDGRAGGDGAFVGVAPVGDF
jgi:hypothetical protein